MENNTKNDFFTEIQQEKRNHITNLSQGKEGLFESPDFDEEAVRQYFADKNVNPKTIADFFKASGKGKAYLEWQFPQLQFEKNTEETIASIKKLRPEGFKDPKDLMIAISQYIRNNMSYDLLTVLFAPPEGTDYPDFIKQALQNPQAKFDMSKQEEDQLKYLAMNIQINSHYNAKNDAMLMKMIGANKEWLRHQAMNDDDFQVLLQTIGKYYGYFLYNSYNSGSLQINEQTSRDVTEMLDTVRVGVCRDFAMMAKKIYEKMAKEQFADSEAIYVSNLAQKHAYVLLAYEKDGKIEKQYFDPTAFITWWSLLQHPNGMLYGDKKNEVWAKNDSPNENTKMG